MKLLALLVGFYSALGLGGAVVAATMQDPRARPLIFGMEALIMSIAGFRASRAIWRRHASAERRFYVWAVALTVMFASLGVAFPVVLKHRGDVWIQSASGVVLFSIFVAMSGRFIRRRA